jgi:hypothetical protein
MSIEAAAPITGPSIEQGPLVSRRTLLRTALGVGAVIAVPGLAACGDDEPYELPSGGFPSVHTDPAEVTGQRDPRTPDTTPSSDVAGTRTPEPSPTAEQVKPRIEGHKLNDLKPITWKSTENPDLADDIREHGKAVQGDPESTGADPDYYRRAIVLGVPADKAKNKTVRLAITLQDPSQPAGAKVVYVTLPKGTVDVGSQQVSLMPTPTTSARVHPYRLRLSAANVSVAFLTSADKETWTIVAPHVITPSATVGNGTYSNAHVL